MSQEDKVRAFEAMAKHLAIDRHDYKYPGIAQDRHAIQPGRLVRDKLYLPLTPVPPDLYPNNDNAVAAKPDALAVAAEAGVHNVPEASPDNPSVVDGPMLNEAAAAERKHEFHEYTVSCFVFDAVFFGPILTAFCLLLLLSPGDHLFAQNRGRISKHAASDRACSLVVLTTLSLLQPNSRLLAFRLPFAARLSPRKSAKEMNKQYCHHEDLAGLVEYDDPKYFSKSYLVKTPKWPRHCDSCKKEFVTGKKFTQCSPAEYPIKAGQKVVFMCPHAANSTHICTFGLCGDCYCTATVADNLTGKGKRIRIKRKRD
jgi:hypothetical protein